MEQTLTVYLILNLIASVMSIIFACCFLFITSLPIESLANYRHSRKIMAFAYFILGFGSLYEILSQKTGETIDTAVAFSSVISISSLQAFAFTYTLITLLNPSFLTRRKLVVQLSLITAFILFTIPSLFIFPPVIHQLMTVLFIVFYIFQLVYYTRIFLREETHFRERLDTIYSDNEAQRLNWVKTAFFSSLAMGILAGLSLFSISPFLMIMLIIYYLVFYTYFAIRYLNYPGTFAVIRESLEVKTIPASSISYSELEGKLEEWVGQKGYIRCGITINDLANKFYTNRTYLSTYINAHTKMNFNTWINTLRIEEAVSLMQNHPDWPLSRISEEVGYPDQSCFGKQFRKITGLTPRTVHANCQQSTVADNALPG